MNEGFDIVAILDRVLTLWREVTDGTPPVGLQVGFVVESLWRHRMFDLIAAHAMWPGAVYSAPAGGLLFRGLPVVLATEIPPWSVLVLGAS